MTLDSSFLRPPPSLSSRLRTSATCLTLLFFSFVGVVIDHAYQVSLLNAVEERLQAQIYTLLSLADVEGPTIDLPDDLAEARFNQFDSGLYAFVLDKDANPLWQSKSSLLLDHLGLYRIDRNTREFVELESPDSRFNALSQGILWQGLNGNSLELTLWILEDAQFYKQPLSKFRWILWSGLFLVAALLYFSLWGLMYWALMPLNDLATDVERIEAGKLSALPSHYPRELRRLSHAFNLMLAHERQQIDRYKLTLADLAHSLKTPLSVIKAVLHQETKVDPQTALGINQQLDRMNQSVGYHLKRPVHQPAYSKKTKVPIAPSVYRVVNALSKVYAEKNITFQVDIPEGVMFPGPEDDLFEVLGNLLENACKYGNSAIAVGANQQQGPNSTSIVEFWVDDDGSGVPHDKRRHISKRGVRLDSQEEGQGLGLALVKDILQNYDTQLEIGDSPLGGARFKITFIHS